MAAKYNWKQADTEPLELTLGNDRPNWSLELSPGVPNGTVVLNMRNSSRTVKISRGACTITGPRTVRFVPTAAQTNVTRGTYSVEVEWTDSNGVVSTFPSFGFLEIFIDQQIA